MLTERDINSESENLIAEEDIKIEPCEEHEDCDKGNTIEFSYTLNLSFNKSDNGEKSKEKSVTTDSANNKLEYIRVCSDNTIDTNSENPWNLTQTTIPNSLKRFLCNKGLGVYEKKLNKSVTSLSKNVVKQKLVSSPVSDKTTLADLSYSTFQKPLQECSAQPNISSFTKSQSYQNLSCENHSEEIIKKGKTPMDSDLGEDEYPLRNSKNIEHTDDTFHTDDFAVKSQMINCIQESGKTKTKESEKRMVKNVLKDAKINNYFDQLMNNTNVFNDKLLDDLDQHVNSRNSSTYDNGSSCQVKSRKEKKKQKLKDFDNVAENNGTLTDTADVETIGTRKVCNGNIDQSMNKVENHETKVMKENLLKDIDQQMNSSTHDAEVFCHIKNGKKKTKRKFGDMNDVHKENIDNLLNGANIDEPKILGKILLENSSQHIDSTNNYTDDNASYLPEISRKKKKKQQLIEDGDRINNDNNGTAINNLEIIGTSIGHKENIDKLTNDADVNEPNALREKLLEDLNQHINSNSRSIEEVDASCTQIKRKKKKKKRELLEDIDPSAEDFGTSNSVCVEAAVDETDSLRKKLLEDLNGHTKTNSSIEDNVSCMLEMNKKKKKKKQRLLDDIDWIDKEQKSTPKSDVEATHTRKVPKETNDHLMNRAVVDETDVLRKKLLEDFSQHTNSNCVDDYASYMLEKGEKKKKKRRSREDIERNAENNEETININSANDLRKKLLKDLNGHMNSNISSAEDNASCMLEIYNKKRNKKKKLLVENEDNSLNEANVDETDALKKKLLEDLHKHINSKIMLTENNALCTSERSKKKKKQKLSEDADAEASGTNEVPEGSSIDDSASSMLRKNKEKKKKQKFIDVITDAEVIKSSKEHNENIFNDDKFGDKELEFDLKSKRAKKHKKNRDTDYLTYESIGKIAEDFSDSKVEGQPVLGTQKIHKQSELVISTDFIEDVSEKKRKDRKRRKNSEFHKMDEQNEGNEGDDILKFKKQKNDSFCDTTDLEEVEDYRPKSKKSKKSKRVAVSELDISNEDCQSIDERDSKLKKKKTLLKEIGGHAIDKDKMIENNSSLDLEKNSQILNDETDSQERLIKKKTKLSRPIKTIEACYRNQSILNNDEHTIDVNSTEDEQFSQFDKEKKKREIQVRSSLTGRVPEPLNESEVVGNQHESEVFFSIKREKNERQKSPSEKEGGFRKNADDETNFYSRQKKKNAEDSEGCADSMVEEETILETESKEMSFDSSRENRSKASRVEDNQESNTPTQSHIEKKKKLEAVACEISSDDSTNRKKYVLPKSSSEDPEESDCSVRSEKRKKKKPKATLQENSPTKRRSDALEENKRRSSDKNNGKKFKSPKKERETSNSSLEKILYDGSEDIFSGIFTKRENISNSEVSSDDTNLGNSTSAMDCDFTINEHISGITDDRPTGSNLNESFTFSDILSQTHNQRLDEKYQKIIAGSISDTTKHSVGDEGYVCDELNTTSKSESKKKKFNSSLDKFIIREEELHAIRRKQKALELLEQDKNIKEIEDELEISHLDQESKIQDLEIQIFSVPLIHRIAHYLGNNPSEEQRSELKSAGIRLKVGKFTKSEDEKLRKRWKQFCEEHDWNENHYHIFLHGSNKSKHGKLTPVQFRKFVQYISYEFEDRVMINIYKRFKRLFSNCPKTNFTEEDDNIIKEYVYSGKSHTPFADLAIILDKDRGAIMKRYSLYKSNMKNYNEKVVWNKELTEKLFANLIEVTRSISLSELKHRTITRREWEKISNKMNIPVEKLKRAWTFNFYPRFFSPNYVEEMRDVKIKLINLLGERYNDYKEIDWHELAEEFSDGFTAPRITKLFHDLLRKKVPLSKRHNFRKAIKILKKSSDLRVTRDKFTFLKNILEETKNGSICSRIAREGSNSKQIEEEDDDDVSDANAIS